MNFTKNYFTKNTRKEGVVNSDFFSISSGSDTNKITLAEKISVYGMTWNDMENIYLSNEWVRGIVDKIVDRVSNVNPIIKPVSVKIGESASTISDSVKKNMDIIYENLILSPNSNNESFTQLRKKISRDLLKFDAAGIELVSQIDSSNKNKKVELFSTPGNTIKLNVAKNGLLPEKDSYIQVDEGLREVAAWGKNEFIYFMMNPQSNKIYGLSPLETLTKAVLADLLSSEYNMNFYANNATPRYAILMEGMGLGQGNSAMRRFREWYDKELLGKPHRPIILGTEQGKINFQKIGSENKDMEFLAYSMWILNKVMVVYKMQPIILGISTQFIKAADAKDQQLIFKQEAIYPQLSLFAEKINKHVINDIYKMKDVYLDFDLDLYDTKERAEIDERYSRMGVITINEIRVKVLGLTPVPWGDVPYLQNNLVAFGQNKDGTSAVPSKTTDGETAPNVPNISTSNKKYIENYLASNEIIVGWEDLEIVQRIEIITKLLKEKESMLSKSFFNLKD